MQTFPHEQCHTTQTHSSDSQFKELSFTVISFLMTLRHFLMTVIKITDYIACVCVWGHRSLSVVLEDNSDPGLTAATTLA